MSDVLDKDDFGEKAPRSRRKAKGSGHLRRAEILEAAEKIFLECGYAGATIRKIADAVGVSSTALYMHFRDKDEILVEICETTFAQVLAQNTEIAGLRIEPVARVRRMLEAYMAFALEHPNAYQLVFCSPRGAVLSEERSEALRGLGRRCYDLFAGAVQAVADAGRLKCSDVDAAAQTSWAASHGLVTLLITEPHFDWVARDTLTTLMIDSVFHGLVRD